MSDPTKTPSMEERIECLEMPHKHCHCGLSMDQYAEECIECVEREQRLVQEAADKDFIKELKAKGEY